VLGFGQLGLLHAWTQGKQVHLELSPVIRLAQAAAFVDLVLAVVNNA
jgi:hypothetical protein